VQAAPSSGTGSRISAPVDASSGEAGGVPGGAASGQGSRSFDGSKKPDEVCALLYSMCTVHSSALVCTYHSVPKLFLMSTK